MEGMEENSDRFNDDPWAIAGLVLGLGNSVVALYRLGAYGKQQQQHNLELMALLLKSRTY